MTKDAISVTDWLAKRVGVKHKQIRDLIQRQDRALAHNTVKLAELEAAVERLETALGTGPTKSAVHTIDTATEHLTTLRRLAAGGDIPKAVDLWLEEAGVEVVADHVVISVESMVMMVGVNVAAKSC